MQLLCFSNISTTTTTIVIFSINSILIKILSINHNTIRTYIDAYYCTII